MVQKRTLLALLTFLCSAAPAVKGDSPQQKESNEGVTTGNQGGLARKIVQKVIVEERGKRILPYDYLQDEQARYYFCMGGCSAARFRAQHEEYMLVASYEPNAWLVCPLPLNLENCKPDTHQALSIYECAYRKSSRKPCIYDDHYEEFIDEDADGTLDFLVVRRGGTEHAYDFSDGIVQRVMVDYETDFSEWKMQRSKKKQAQKRYEKLLAIIAKAYGL